MATKTRKDDTLDEAVGADVIDREILALERIRAAKEADTGDAFWKVYVTRLSGPNKASDGKEARVKECSLDDVEALGESLRNEFGDGVYRIRARRNNRNIEQWDLQIELSPAERAAFKRRIAVLESGAQPASSGLPAVASAPGSDIAAVIGDAMRYQADMMRDVIAQLRPTQSADPMENFAKTMTAFATFQQALPRSEATTGLSMFEKGMQFAEKMIDKRGDPGEAPVTLLGLFREAIANPDIGVAIRETARRFAPERPQVRRPPAGQEGRQLLRQPASAPAPVPAAQAAAPAPASAPAQTPEQKAIEYLLGQAAIGAEPALLANTALQLIPEARLDLLGALPEREAIEMLILYYPKVAEYRAWFTALIGAMYEPEGSEDAPAKPESAGALPASPDTGERQGDS